MSFTDRILGKPLASHEEDEQKVGPLAAVPKLGLDGLASAAYGPEAAMTILIPLGALRLPPDVIGVHVSTDDAEARRLAEDRETSVVLPAQAAGLRAPRLITVRSPYRRLFGPLLDQVNQLKRDYPDRQIAVIITELVESHWAQYLLHNQRATGLKAALLLRGDNRVAVINAPWYLGGYVSL